VTLARWQLSDSASNGRNGGDWEPKPSVVPDGDSTTSDVVDPEDFLRALLKISPEDAESVREDAPATRKRNEGQEGPTADYGEDNPDEQQQPLTSG